MTKKSNEPELRTLADVLKEEAKTMKKCETLENEFEWIPPHKRMSRFGGPVPPGKPETRTPLIWVVSRKNMCGHKLYLVNLTGEALEFVKADSGGYQTYDDEVFLKSINGYSYANVAPGVAVKIAQFDGYDDLDSIMRTEVKVKSAKMGQWSLYTPEQRGGFKGDRVLLWQEEINRCKSKRK